MIFYFSATGNSKYVATKIGEEFGGRIIDIAQTYKDVEQEYNIGDEEKVFFVFPVYFYGIPNIVADFIDKIKLNGKNIEICGIATCGSSAGSTDRMFKKAFKAKDLEVKGFYTVKMVDNYVLMFKMPLIEEQIMKLRRSDDEIQNVIDSINFNYRVTYNSSIGSAALSKVIYSLYDGHCKTKKFYAKNNCNGCNLCESICPVNAIVMKNGKPEWTKDQCVHCLACINRCPSSAIEYGKGTAKRGRYVNPNIEL